MLDLAVSYSKVCSHFGYLLNLLYNYVYLFVQALEDESKMTKEQLALKNVGKQVSIVV